MNHNPLVTIAVITYNSSEYVIETLESIKRQTYKNIELIISDDNSKDNTIDLCKLWLHKHRSEFQRVKLLTSTENTGVSGNCNRALHEAHGIWFKGIAGDDILFDDAIEKYVKFTEEHPQSKIIFADFVNFTDIFSNGNFSNGFVSLRNVFFNEKVSVNRQYSIISKMFVGCGPTHFISTDVIREVGGFDERYPLQEDYPLYINIVKHGYKMYLLPEPTVYYRHHDTSITGEKDNNSIYKKTTIRYVMEYKYAYQRENLSFFWRCLLDFSIWTISLVIKAGNDKRSLKCQCLFWINRLVNPFGWYQRIIHTVDKLFK